MQTSLTTRLISNARLALPGAVDGVLKYEFFNVAKEFFNETKIWQDTITVSVTSATTSYEIAPTGDGNIATLMSVVDSNGFGVRATMQEPSTLVLTTTPSQNLTYTVVVALNVVEPLDSSSYPTFPDWVLDKYDVYLLDGLLGRMMAQPAKPYSNDRMAIYHTRKFQMGMQQARAESRHMNIYDGQRWGYPPTFRTTRKRGGTISGTNEFQF